MTPVIVLVALSSCAPQSPITEGRAREIPLAVALVEERLLKVNQELVDLRNTADLKVQAENSISESAHEVRDIAGVLSMIRTILAEPTAR